MLLTPLRRLGGPALIVTLAATTSFGCKKKDEKPASESPPAEAPAEAPKAETPAVPAPGSLPREFPEMLIPEDNPQTPEKIALGHQLFFDKRLSADGSLSCYDCHKNEDGGGGGTPLAVGAGGKALTRHSPVIWNVGYLQAFYWHGRAPTLEAQGRAAWAGGNMGVGEENLEKKAKEIAKIPAYKKQFAAVFPDEGVTPETIIKAISAYERTLVCNETAYDRYAGGDASALDDTQKQGLALFMGKAGCNACHAPPFFSTAMGVPGGVYFNAGIGTEGKDEAEVDVGRYKVTEKDIDWAAFKIPSLRNVSKSAPYFHDGSVESLEEAVRLMAGGGIDNKNKSQLLVDKKLSDEEVGALVSFLGALECGELEEPELP